MTPVNPSAERPDLLYQSWVERWDQWAAMQRGTNLLVQGKTLPYEPTAMGVVRYYMHPDLSGTRVLPDWYSFVMRVNRHTGKHVHQGGVVIYVLDGSGWVDIEGTRLDWEAGDLLLLPIRPGGFEHQFFNADPEAGCHWLATLFIPFWHLMGGQMVQTAFAPEFQTRGSRTGVSSAGSTRSTRAAAVGAAVAETGRAPRELAPFQDGNARREALGVVNLYDELLALRDLQRQRYERALVRIRSADLPLERSPMGLVRWFTHPLLYDTASRCEVVYELTLEPGGWSGRMARAGNYLVYVLEGRGHSIVNGRRYDWTAEDMLQIPAPPEGVVYQHVNDSDRSSRLLCFEPNFVDVLGVDCGARFECLEPASAWERFTRDPERG